MKIITRFAPSPTGQFHIGSARTAFYSWLFAKQNGGKFIFRIDDTDLSRSNNKYVKNIIDSMIWLNINWDEGPYYQSKRYNRYYEIINNMLKQGTAYRCYCSKERLNNVRDMQLKSGYKPRYDGHCRNLFLSNKHNKPYVIRFRNPLNGSVIFNDIIRGVIEFKNSELDDLIIQKSDGTPTYNFCVVIDDYDMQISHIIRGSDHINNTPRQINILKSLNAPIPKYAHVSMILEENKKKISKRNDCSKINILYYRDKGFLPIALNNYLLLLGWSYKNKEFFSIDEMKKYFNINKVSKSPSIFSYKKLLWINNYYINYSSIKYIYPYILECFQKRDIDVSLGPTVEELLHLFAKRCNTLTEIVSESDYLYKDIQKFNIQSVKKYLLKESIPLLKMVRDKISKIEKWNKENIKNILIDITNKFNIHISKIAMPLRVAITGSSNSPSINDIIYYVGCSRVILRINQAIDIINYINK